MAVRNVLLRWWGWGSNSGIEKGNAENAAAETSCKRHRSDCCAGLTCRITVLTVKTSHREGTRPNSLHKHKSKCKIFHFISSHKD